MGNTDLVLQGVQLMFIGMGMVFVFLSILVFCTGFMQKLLIEKSVPTTSPKIKTQPDDEEIAAISIAIHQFRKTDVNNRKNDQ